MPGQDNTDTNTEWNKLLGSHYRGNMGREKWHENRGEPKGQLRTIISHLSRHRQGYQATPETWGKALCWARDLRCSDMLRRGMEEGWGGGHSILFHCWIPTVICLEQIRSARSAQDGPSSCLIPVTRNRDTRTSCVVYTHTWMGNHGVLGRPSPKGSAADLIRNIRCTISIRRQHLLLCFWDFLF